MRKVMRHAWRPLEGEEPLLAAVLANPEDDGPRAVYADWLRDRDPQRAAYLQLTLTEHLDASDRDAEWAALAHDSRPIGPGSTHRPPPPPVPAPWLALIERTELYNCPQTLGPSTEHAEACPQRWEALRLTANPQVRHCPICSRPVTFLTTIYELNAHSEFRSCVAVEGTLPPPFEPYESEGPAYQSQVQPPPTPRTVPPRLGASELYKGQHVTVMHHGAQPATVLSVGEKEVTVSIEGREVLVWPDQVMMSAP